MITTFAATRRQYLINWTLLSSITQRLQATYETAPTEVVKKRQTWNLIIVIVKVLRSAWMFFSCFHRKTLGGFTQLWSNYVRVCCLAFNWNKMFNSIIWYAIRRQKLLDCYKVVDNKFTFIWIRFFVYHSMWNCCLESISFKPDTLRAVVLGLRKTGTIRVAVRRGEDKCEVRRAKAS